MTEPGSNYKIRVSSKPIFLPLNLKTQYGFRTSILSNLHTKENNPVFPQISYEPACTTPPR